MILLLHNRYRTTGGEERAVDDMLWLLREHVGEEAELIARDSATLGRARAASAMLRGGLDPDDVGAAVRRTGARVVHAHNVNPAFGARALHAARRAGARVVLHLHNYRLVCAVGTCFTRGEDCTRCHGRNTLPGVRLACRGARVESAIYGAGLALHQQELAAAVNAFVVPSSFALRRLEALGAPLGGRARAIASVQREFALRSSAGSGRYALFAGRLTAEKGPALAVQACARAGIPLVVAGDGPQAAELRSLAAGADVRFEGPVTPARLRDLRAGAGLALVPSRYAEIFPLAAAEAMAAALPTLAPALGGLADFVPVQEQFDPRDPLALAELVAARFKDEAAGARALEAARARCSPDTIAAALTEVYDEVTTSTL